MKYRINPKEMVRYLIATLAMLLIVACKDDQQVVTGFAVDQTEVTFINDGGTTQLNIATDEAWTVSTSADWCMVTPANGVGSAVCVLKADSSYLYKERIGKIQIHTAHGTKEITIKQYGYDPVISFTQTEVSIPSYAAPDKAYIDVEASGNIPFQIRLKEEDKAWLSIEGSDSYQPSTTIPQKRKFRFKFKTHTEFSADRIAQVTFKEVKTNRDGSIEPLEKVLEIRQEAAPKIIPSREGDSLAILSIARTLNVNVAWPITRPMIYWEDVETAERTYMYDDGNGRREERTELRVVSVRLYMLETEESLPYQIKYLTELETFIAIGNSNAYLKKIDLGPEVTLLKKLKSLSLTGYGIRSLPQEMKGMTSLEELNLSGNMFMELPMDVLFELPNLKYLSFANNRASGSVTNLKTDIPRGFTLETIGLGGEIPADIFRLNSLEYLSLSYNYFYGDIPAMDGDVNVMPNLKYLGINLNRLTGNLPDWILYHDRLACWDPYVLVFNQEGRDHRGDPAGFSNEPPRLPNPVCPDWNNEEEEILLKLPKLTARDIETKVPLHGRWRYYNMLTK